MASRQTQQPVEISNASRSPVNRRLETRSPHKAVLIMPFGEGKDLHFEQATLIDCSLNGVGILFQRPLDPNIRFFIKLKLGRVSLVIYTVCYCQAVEEGYRIGAIFTGLVGAAADSNVEPKDIYEALLVL